MKNNSNSLSNGGGHFLNLFNHIPLVDDSTELFKVDPPIFVSIDGPHSFVHNLLELRFLQVLAHHGTYDLSKTLLEYLGWDEYEQTAN